MIRKGRREREVKGVGTRKVRVRKDKREVSDQSKV